MDSAGCDDSELPDHGDLTGHGDPPDHDAPTARGDLPDHGALPDDGDPPGAGGVAGNAHFWAPAVPARAARPAHRPSRTAPGNADGRGEPSGAGAPDDPDEELQPWQLDRTRAPVATKIVVAGGFGVGKTTLVTTVSEITPLETEALMTVASEGTDDLGPTPDKRTTTVAMDFGRITLDDNLVLYLFGTPGQQRFWFMWDDLSRGAIGAVVLVDTRRLPDSFPVLDYFESCGMPYVVAVNHFDGTEKFAADDVRDALTVPPHIPVLVMDARLRVPVIDTLLALVGHALDATPA